MALLSSAIAQMEEFPQWALLPGKIKIKQHYKYDCGAACLASVAAFYGIYHSLAHIRMLCGCTPDGISIQGIIDGAAQMGLRAKGLLSKGKSIEGINTIALPAIAHIKDDGDYLHYIVIYGCGGRWMKIMDPATGKIEKIYKVDFEKKWTGYIITLSPDTGLKRGKTHTGRWESLKPIIMGNLKELLLTLAATAFCTGAAIGTTLLLQQIIDRILPQGDTVSLIAVSLVAAFLMLASLYAGYKASQYLIKCSICTECSLTASYVHKLFRLPLAFFDNYTSGDISSRRDDIHLIRSFITGGVIGIVTSLITLAGALGAMFLYNIRLATIIALFIPLYWVIYRVSGRINTKYGKEVATANAGLESAMLSSIPMASAIRHYNCGEFAAEKIGRKQIILAEKLQGSARAVNALETVLEGVSKLLVWIILSAGSFAVLHGEITLGELVGFYSLCSFFTIPVNDLIGASDTIARAKVAYERIFEILSLQEADEDEGTLSPIELEGDILINDLHFKYPGRASLFNGFSARIKKGEITRIDGDNGSGKSTLLHLIMRDFSPQEGEICYGSINIMQFNGKKWRDMIGYVGQHPILMEGSILENIALGEVQPDIGRIMGICTRLDMDEMLKRFPQGLLTPVGNSGRGLSGGECQKICIARAMYRDARIYIFDEATSSMTAEGEECVAGCINFLKSEGKTVIYISHKRENRILTDNVVTIN